MSLPLSQGSCGLALCVSMHNAHYCSADGVVSEHCPVIQHGMVWSLST